MSTMQELIDQDVLRMKAAFAGQPPSNGGTAVGVAPEPTPFERRAQILLARNIPVAPLPPRTKVAKLKNWETLATTDVQKLVELNPDSDGNTAAIARAELGGFCFFEVDKPNFHTVIQEQTGQKFPDTLLVSSSPGKGRGHFYFKHTPKSIALGNAQAKDEQGEVWSFRADRRYVVGPLSVKDDGTVYTVIKDHPIADIPDWLVEYISSANKTEARKKTGHVELHSEEPIAEGSRNSTLTSILGKARQVLAMDKEQLLAYGLSVNQKRCVPPLTDEEVKTIANSIGRYEVTVAPPVPFNAYAGQQTQPERPMETESVNPSDVAGSSLDWLPETTLASTRLQDIYMDHFADNGWPLSLALPALVTAASVVVPPRTELVLGDNMTNLYTALIAPVNAGKSQVIEWACKAVGIYDNPIGSHYFEVKSGSAEQLVKSLSKKQSMFTQKTCLINPDEWAHLFSKATIPDASFPSVLTTSFYKRNQIFTLGGTDGGKEYALNLSMSFIGGIVEEDFDSVFGASTLGGLYDRFLFGRAPDGFRWNYVPCPIPTERYFTTWDLKPVRIKPEVYEVTKAWGKEMPGLGRVAEVCVRIATIYASLDGRPEVQASDIEVLKPLALYQMGLRQAFRPNPGQSPDAIFANKALAWIQTNAREWTSIAKLKQRTWRIEEKLGPQVAVRSLLSLARSGRIELWLTYEGKPLPPDYQGPIPRIGLVRMVK